MAQARQLPFSMEAEQAILGAMLIYPSVVRDVNDQDLVKEDFFAENHQRIFEAMMTLADAGKPVEATGLISRLQDTGELSIVGGADYIVRLCDEAISSANSVFYIEEIKNKAHLRRLITTAEKIAQKGFDSASPLDDVMDLAEKQILEVTRSRRTTNFRSARDVVGEVMDKIRLIRESENRITGIQTGYTRLDQITNGFQRGDLIILAARPSVGKTAFALNVALQSALRNPNAIAIFSLEMPAEQLMRRILSAKASIRGDQLRSGYLNNAEMNQLSEAASELKNIKIFIDDSAMIKMGDIFSKCRKLKSEHGLDMIIIDYLQLITGSGRSGSDNRQQEVSEISRSLKALARELDVPVIALSQLSRGVETRQDKHPLLSDLRESGSIEQDADIVMFLYREKYQNHSENEEPSEYEDVDVDIAKHRNGATERFKLVFNRSINAFYNYENN